MFAKFVSLSRPRRRSASTSTHSKTSPCSLTTLWTLWVRSSDNVFVKFKIKTFHFYNFWFRWTRKTEGTEQSPSYTPRIASPCVWSQHTCVNGMPSFLVSGTLRSRVHVARAERMSICDPFPLGHAEILRQQKKARLLIPQLVARGYPLDILVLGTLTHKSPRCLQVRNGYSDVTTGCASSILAGCLQSCSWARGLLFELVQALEYV